MKFYQKLLAATALVALMSGAASAKTFVYCSPASPEGFDPAAYTGGDTFDASAHPVYNRLAEFENGTTKVVPGLAESWDVSDDGLNIPSICARASSSIRATISRRPAISTRMT